MLRPEWFEPELLRRESNRGDESGRDKRPLRHTHIFVDPAARYQKNQTWDRMELHPRLGERAFARTSLVAFCGKCDKRVAIWWKRDRAVNGVRYCLAGTFAWFLRGL